MTHSAEIFIGTSGWTYNHWKEVFYPPGLARSKWFDYYRQQFSTVEINATYYRSFNDQTYHNWYGQADEGFKYVLKVPKTITHHKKLVDVSEELNKFYRSATLLKDKLGLILMQLHPAIQKDIGLLESVLSDFEGKKKTALEFRNKTWFDNETIKFCSENEIVFCNVDSYRFTITYYVTSDEVYLRFHGRTYGYRYNYSETELTEIARHILKLKEEKEIKCIFCFFNNDFFGHAPQNAARLKKILAIES